MNLPCPFLTAVVCCLGCFVSIGFAASDTVITVDATTVSAAPIPRTIFGTFLEPIGRSIYEGVWAQLLINPSFEANLWSPAVMRNLLQQRPELVDSSTLGLPLPWQPLTPQGWRYENRWHDAANSERSLLIMARPDQETGVRQTIYPPAQRTLEYKGSLYVKRENGPATIVVSLRRHDHPDEVFSEQSFDADSDAWVKHEFTLSLQAGRVKSLEPVDFAISLTSAQRVLVDQASLFPADAVDGLDPDMVKLSREMHTSVVRFGGNYTSAYHWRNGVGPPDKRWTMANQPWGLPDYNQFGTDEFLKFCEQIHAEPQIALNMGSGTPQEAADWVKYVDAKWGDHHGGLLWELGNELWGDWQMGYPTIGEVAQRTVAFSKAVKDADPTARLIATGGNPDQFQQWTAAQLAGAPGAYSYLSAHFVVGDDVVQTNPSTDFLAYVSMALPVGVEQRLTPMKQQIEADPNARGKVKLAFTEWLFVGEGARIPNYTNMGGAINVAGFLNMLLRNADFVPISDMTGGIWFQGIWKKRGQVYATPPYWAFRMYANADISKTVAVKTLGATYDVHQGVRNIPEIPGVPYVDVVAAINAAGNKLTLFCVNRKLDGYAHAAIHFNGFEPEAAARMQVLRGVDLYSFNDETKSDAVLPKTQQIGSGDELILPPASVVVIEYRRR